MQGPSNLLWGDMPFYIEKNYIIDLCYYYHYYHYSNIIFIKT